MSGQNIFLLIVAIVLLGAGAWWVSDVPRPSGEEYLEDTMSTNADMLGGASVYEVAVSDVAYHEGKTGFYAHPAEEGDFPGVVMVHEWWGLNEYMKETARQLAGHGYRVLAVDLFGEVATTPDRARVLTGAIVPSEAVQNMRSAVIFLRENGSTRVASLGWCFGGGQALQLALAEGERLDATVIYYGQLVTDASALRHITWPVLGIFGEEDTSIPVERVQAFQAGLSEAGVENQVIIYPGVGHAFANPSGANYAPDETRDAWTKTLGFLEANLK